MIGVKARRIIIIKLNQIVLLDFFRRIKIKRLIKIKERTYGGLSWFDGDCIAQKRDSPLIWPDFIKDANHPKELAKEFRKIRIIPPENFPVIFWPILYEVISRIMVEIMGKIWKYQIEESTVLIFEREKLKYHKMGDSCLVIRQNKLGVLF